MQHANEKVALCIKRIKLLRNSINCEHQKYILNVTVLQGRLSQSGVGILNCEQQWLWRCGRSHALIFNVNSRNTMNIPKIFQAFMVLLV